MKKKIVAMLAVVVLGAAAIAVSAGAFDRAPVAPQLTPKAAGLKPGAVPGEVRVFHSPNGEKVTAEVSPCIKSDPTGYSNAELSDPEWCFHRPGQAAKAKAER